VFGWILDRTGSWTLPFAVSLGLLSLGAVVAFWIRPDRQLSADPIAGRLVLAS